MDENNFNDFINYCLNCYKQSCNNSTENDEGTSDNTGSSNNYDPNAGYYCGDVPGGFQAINPQFFLVMGEIIGNVIAGNLPFNIQNVLGNWLELVGQVIETYNAQQQYMQSGPGRYYDIRNINVNNPFCTQSTTSTTTTSTSTNEDNNKTKTKTKTTTTSGSPFEDSGQFVNRDGIGSNKRGTGSTSTSDSSTSSGEATGDVREYINSLRDEVAELRAEVEKLKNKG